MNDNIQSEVNRLSPEARAELRAYVQKNISPFASVWKTEERLKALEKELESVEQQEQGARRVRDAAIASADNVRNEVVTTANNRYAKVRYEAEATYQATIANLPLAQSRQAVQDAGKAVQAAKEAVPHKSV